MKSASEHLRGSGVPGAHPGETREWTAEDWSEAFKRLKEKRVAQLDEARRKGVSVVGELNEFQDDVVRGVRYPDRGGTGGLLLSVLALSAAAGRLADGISGLMRDGELSSAYDQAVGDGLVDSVGDVLHQVMLVLDELDVDLEYAAVKLLDRLVVT